MNEKSGHAYSELVEFLTSGPTHEEIIEFTASNDTRKRVKYLMNAYRAGMLTPEEREELEEFQRVEEFLRQLKERAQRKNLQ
jgi:hypothetical protein